MADDWNCRAALTMASPDHGNNRSWDWRRSLEKVVIPDFEVISKVHLWKLYKFYHAINKKQSPPDRYSYGEQLSKDRAHFIHCARNYEILIAVFIVCLICLRSSGNDFPSSPLLARKWLEGSRWAPRSVCSQPLSPLLLPSAVCWLYIKKTVRTPFLYPYFPVLPYCFLFL